MENIQLNNPNSRLQSPSQDTVKPSLSVSLNPQFDALSEPKTFVNHIGELTEQKATPHGEILSELLEQFEPLDFEVEANPNGKDDFKLSQKHFLVLSIENVIRVAESNQWGLCKHHDFITSLTVVIGLKSIARPSKVLGNAVENGRTHLLSKPFASNNYSSPYRRHISILRHRWSTKSHQLEERNL